MGRVSAEHVARRVRMSRFRCVVLEAWETHDLTTEEFIAAMAETLSSVAARHLNRPEGED